MQVKTLYDILTSRNNAAIVHTLDYVRIVLHKTLNKITRYHYVVAGIKIKMAG